MRVLHPWDSFSVGNLCGCNLYKGTLDLNSFNGLLAPPLGQDNLNNYLYSGLYGINDVVCGETAQSKQIQSALSQSQQLRPGEKKAQEIKNST